MSGQNHKMKPVKSSSGSPGIFSNPWTAYKPDHGLTTKELIVSAKPVEIGKVYKHFQK